MYSPAPRSLTSGLLSRLCRKGEARPRSDLRPPDRRSRRAIQRSERCLGTTARYGVPMGTPVAGPERKFRRTKKEEELARIDGELAKLGLPKGALPKRWPTRVKSAALHVLGLCRAASRTGQPPRHRPARLTRRETEPGRRHAAPRPRCVLWGKTGQCGTCLLVCIGRLKVAELLQAQRSSSSGGAASIIDARRSARKREISSPVHSPAAVPCFERCEAGDRCRSPARDDAPQSDFACSRRYAATPAASAFIEARPFCQPAGQTSPCSSVNCRASTRRKVSSTERPRGRSLMVS